MWARPARWIYCTRADTDIAFHPMMDDLLYHHRGSLEYCPSSPYQLLLLTSSTRRCRFVWSPRVPPTKSKPFVTEQTVLSSACHPVQNGNDWIVVCSLHCNEYCTQGNGWFSSRVITHATYWKSRSDLLVLPPCPHRQIKGPRQSQSPDFLFSDSTGKMTRVFRISMARWMGWPRRWTVP